MKKQIFYLSLTCILGSFSLTSLWGMENDNDIDSKSYSATARRQAYSSDSLYSDEFYAARADTPNVADRERKQAAETARRRPTRDRAAQGQANSRSVPLGSTININIGHPQPPTAQIPPAQLDQPLSQQPAVQPAVVAAVQPPVQPAVVGSWPSYAWECIKEHPYLTGTSALTLLTGSSALIYYFGSQCKPELTNYPQNYFIDLGTSLKTMDPASGPSILGRNAQRLCMWWILKKAYEYAWYIKWPEAYYEFHKEIKNIRLAPPNPNQNLNGQNPQIQNNQFLIDWTQYLFAMPDALRRSNMEDEQRVIDRMKRVQWIACSLLPGLAAGVTYLFAEKQLVRFFELMAQTHPTPSVFTVGSKGIEAAITTRSIFQSGYDSLKQGWNSFFKK